MMIKSVQQKKIEKKDPYPSRETTTPDMIDRKDPVFYGPRTDTLGPLTSDEIESYEKNGFLFYPELFSPQEVYEFNREVQRLVRLPDTGDNPETIREMNSQTVRSVFYVHRNSDLFRNLVKDSRLLLRARQILDSKVYIHQSRINVKPGLVGKEFYWHSDFETWHVEDGMPGMRALSCSIFLSENNPLNGPTMVIPGSHQKFISCVGRTPEKNYLKSLRKQEYGVPDPEFLAYWDSQRGIVAPTGPAGSVLFFDCNILHGSNGNITPRPRSNAFIVFNSLNNTLIEPFGDQEPRPEFIASRQFIPVEAL